ncbi:rhodanese-like domain-containing protein 9, chloroplastic [Zingiber officinale]|uniref:rhodanese-like domain-containing protein 9, chloroplastic n=1 Tax=Zingiber officinale TaxID=94328 RepID=UPI001C4C4552|nr:rhodanese-like domain-containing protein 9, chloroplastic [Zingiber officinale]
MAVLEFSVTSTPRFRFLQHRKRAPAAVRGEVRYVNGDEAKKLVSEEGFKILDVRDRIQYERAHVAGPCYHVPLFIENKDNDIGTIIKRQVHNNFAGLFFGLAFTKPNPDFIQSVKKQLPEDTKLLVVCQEGLRSAGAADKLDEAGYDNIACLTSGLQSLTPGTFESVGSTELQNAGKAGLVTIQGKISAVLGTVLICAFLFITFFPEQAEKLLQMSPTS